MSLASGERQGSIWEDTLRLGELIAQADLAAAGSHQRAFEHALTRDLRARAQEFHHPLVNPLQGDHQVPVPRVLGEDRRPTLSLDSDGTAIEVRFIDHNPEAVKTAVGQAMVYRLHYRFVILVFVLSATQQEAFEEASGSDSENGLSHLMGHLADQLGIFGIFRTGFAPTSGCPHTLSFLPEQ